MDLVIANSIKRGFRLSARGFTTPTRRLFPVFVIAVADRFDRYKNTAFEYQPPHELARAEIVNVLRDDDFLSIVIEVGITPCSAFKVEATASGYTDATHHVAKVPNRRRFATSAQNLLLVHILDHDLASTAECVRWCRADKDKQ